MIKFEHEKGKLKFEKNFEKLGSFNNVRACKMSITKLNNWIRHLKNTEYVVSTNENIYSMFNIESINNGATIIYDKKITNNAVKNYGFIVPINFENKNDGRATDCL